MDVDSIPILLVTANVGSVFEDPAQLLKIWITEFLEKVALLRPQFLALHLQEVGGKTYEKSMEYVEKFIQMLCENLEDYNRVRIYLDEDFQSAEHFTALGNIYFVHQSLNQVKIWNFLSHEWENVDDKNIHTGNIEAIATKEKSKFPQHFFPECKWSRKGFLRTRWELNCTVIDLVNIHLFHDASNLAACEDFPSVYCKTRRRALVHTLERFHIDSNNGFAPYFVFGDFNFRCDTNGVVKKLSEDLSKHRVQNAKNESTKMQYKNSDGENILIVGKKEFSHINHQIKFKESWLQQFDRELEPLREVLVEYPVTFPPSYPFEEDAELPTNYMLTRCPSWCDRILMSPNARDLIVDEAFSSTDYNVIGENVCMGDHKPIYLSVHLKTLQGIVRSCKCYEHDTNLSTQMQPFVASELDKNIIMLKANPNPNCLYFSIFFKEILIECHKLECKKLINSRIDSLKNLYQTKSSLEKTDNNKIQTVKQQPFISINITDTENFNICMCSLYHAALAVNDEKQIDGTICTKCQNLIKIQSNQHIRTLLTQNLMISDADDIFVNQIDTHYLNTTYFDNNLRQEPYTPESAESHSPCPELEELLNNTAFQSVDKDNNIQTAPLINNNTTTIPYKPNNYLFCKEKPSNSDNNNEQPPQSRELIEHRGVVSPVQLKTRLENLQRTSTDLDNNMEKSKFQRHRIHKKCCTIL